MLIPVVILFIVAIWLIVLYNKRQRFFAIFYNIRKFNVGVGESHVTTGCYYVTTSNGRMFNLSIVKDDIRNKFGYNAGNSVITVYSFNEVTKSEFEIMKE